MNFSRQLSIAIHNAVARYAQMTGHAVERPAHHTGRRPGAERAGYMAVRRYHAERNTTDNGVYTSEKIFTSGRNGQYIGRAFFHRCILYKTSVKIHATVRSAKFDKTARSRIFRFCIFNSDKRHMTISLSAQTNQAHAVQQAWHSFLTTPLDERLGRCTSRSTEEHALTLFHRTVQSVPAYRTFVQQRGIEPDDIRSMDDFRTLPLLTRESYINAFPLPERCRNGRVESNDMVAVSSGSTGTPTFWLRSLADELEITSRFEQIFCDSFRADERSTLAVVCFPLGTWVGGMFTTNCCRWLAARGYRITVVTPGNNPEEIFRVVQSLAPMFEQTVLLGYPPFVKDVVDRGTARAIPWKDYNIKMVFAGEVFSEEWRSLVAERVGTQEPVRDFASLYGTADAGVLGNETPLSIVIRRFLAQHPDAARDLFGESRLPTLVQYDPFDRLFETHDGTLLFSGDNGIPLVRYHIADTGGVVSFADMIASLERYGFDACSEARLTGERGVHELPFVYVFGRSNFTVSYFGANVYPENITVGLEQPGIAGQVTGKFVLQTRETENGDTHLFLAVELAPDAAPSEELRSRIATSVLAHVRRLNSEYAHYVPEEYALPRVTLHAHGDPEYFPAGIKHRYTRK